MAKISVIVPVYNGEQWLDRCFESLRSQTVFQDMEVVIVDDGSTDGSGAKIDAFASECGNVSVFHISNHGVSYARNIGLDKAAGEYIAFLDADDWVDRNCYEVLLKNMAEDCDIVGSGYIVEYTNKTVVNKASSERYLDNAEGIQAFLISSEMSPNTTDKLFRKELLNDIRFDSSLIVSEDRHFLLRSLIKAKKIKLIPFAFYHYYMNDLSATHASVSRKQLDSQVDSFIVDTIKQHYPQYADLAESCAIDHAIRMVGNIYRSGACKQFPTEYQSALKKIRSYSIVKKAKNSSKKHFFSFLLIRIHPALYTAVKYKMKMQYK